MSTAALSSSAGGRASNQPSSSSTSLMALAADSTSEIRLQHGTRSVIKYCFSAGKLLSNFFASQAFHLYVKVWLITTHVGETFNLLPSGAFMGQVITCLDEFARHKLAFLKELSLRQDRHDWANDTSHGAIDLVFQVWNHVLF